MIRRWEIFISNSKVFRFGNIKNDGMSLVSCLLTRLRLDVARPQRAKPSRAMVLGSGTAEAGARSTSPSRTAQAWIGWAVFANRL